MGVTLANAIPKFAINQVNFSYRNMLLKNMLAVYMLVSTNKQSAQAKCTWTTYFRNCSLRILCPGISPPRFCGPSQVNEKKNYCCPSCTTIPRNNSPRATFPRNQKPRYMVSKDQQSQDLLPRGVTKSVHWENQGEHQRSCFQSKCKNIFIKLGGMVAVNAANVTLVMFR